MPYTAEHKAETRARILQHAKELFNLRGYHGVGIDAIMEAAGLTRGGFYAHFKSKEDLLAAVLWNQLEGLRGPDTSSLSQLVNLYVSLAHVRAIEKGCFLPCLTPDVFRAHREVREPFSQAVEALARAYEIRGAGSRDVALSNAAMSVGAVMLARGLRSDAEAEELLAACRRRILGDAFEG